MKNPARTRRKVSRPSLPFSSHPSFALASVFSVRKTSTRTCRLIAVVESAGRPSGSGSGLWRVVQLVIGNELEWFLSCPVRYDTCEFCLATTTLHTRTIPPHPYRFLPRTYVACACLPACPPARRRGATKNNNNNSQNGPGIEVAVS